MPLKLPTRSRLNDLRDELVYEAVVFIVFSFASKEYARTFARVFANGVEAEVHTTL